jgi:glutaredoxin
MGAQRVCGYTTGRLEATMRTVPVFAFVVFATCLTSMALPACSAQSKAADDVTVPSDVSLPVVRDDSTNLLLSFLDAQGRVEAVPTVREVPEAVRNRVLVVDLSKTPEQRQAHKVAFFADLTAKQADGTYPVSVVSRFQAAHGQGAAAASLPPAEGSVIVYSASWCGFCKQAKSWLKGHNVPYVERDVEKTPGAQAELDQKLAKAGTPGGGIPVIDWGGELVMGFDQGSLTRLLAQKPPKATATP